MANGDEVSARVEMARERIWQDGREAQKILSLVIVRANVKVDAGCWIVVA